MLIMWTIGPSSNGLVDTSTATWSSIIGDTRATERRTFSRHGTITYSFHTLVSLAEILLQNVWRSLAFIILKFQYKPHFCFKQVDMLFLFKVEDIYKIYLINILRLSKKCAFYFTQIYLVWIITLVCYATNLSIMFVFWFEKQDNMLLEFKVEDFYKNLSHQPITSFSQMHLAICTYLPLPAPPSITYNVSLKAVKNVFSHMTFSILQSLRLKRNPRVTTLPGYYLIQKQTWQN